MVRPVPAVIEGEQLPHPAEDLSADDDLLSWILVDQLGCLPNTKLGVHPQQVKFVGPPFKTSEILSIVHEAVVNTNMPEAMRRFLEFHLIKAHCDAKQTSKQKDRFVQHLKRYLLPLLPTSRIEIFTTDRYSHITGHAELAVYATRPLPKGAVLHELQGSVVPLPDAWRAEMDIGEEFALGAAGEEDELDSDDEDEGDENGDDESRSRTRDQGSESVVGEENDTAAKRGRRKKEREARGARRSDRTKRRDFSIVWSGLKRCYQLFLGPARFLNHDCNPNVELLRQGKYVTFRAVRPIRIGDEVMTFYGENYFGKNNVECLCLSCEQAGRGGFTPKEPLSEAVSRRRSESVSSSTRATSPLSRRQPGPSALRNALGELDLDTETVDSVEPIAGPSGTHQDDVTEPVTPRKTGSRPSALSVSVSGIGSPATESVRSEPESPSEDYPPKRERYHRRAARNAQHFSFLKRPRKEVVADSRDELQMDEEDEDCVRCVTCAKALHERIWFNNKYFDHCARCVRHALIFDLPWPAHRSADVLDFPPPHLIPSGYVPPRVSSVPLPSLDKHRKKHVEPLPVSPQGETGMERKQWKFRQRNGMDDLLVEQLHEAAWTAQETLENQIHAAEQARLDAKAAREEEKKKKNANRERGSGVWARYEYIDEEELERRRLAKMAVTTGTRRGGRFKPEESEEEVDKDEEDEKEERDVTSVAEPSRHQASPPGKDDNTSRTERCSTEERQLSSTAGPRRQRTSSGTQAKPEPFSPPSRRADRFHMDVVDLAGSTDSESDDFEAIDDPTEQMIAIATRQTEQRSASDSQSVPLASPIVKTNGRTRHVADTGPDSDSDSDSDIQEVVAEMTLNRRISTISPRKPILPTPNGVDDESGPAELRRSEPSRPSSTATGSESPSKRSRGRPKGSGKNQKAAALHATRRQNNQNLSRSGSAESARSNNDSTGALVVAGARSIANSKLVPRSDAVTRVGAGTSTASPSETHLLSGVEKMLSVMDGGSLPHYDWMIESLNQDGSMTFKRMDEGGSTPFPPEEIVRKYVDREHGEFLRLLKPQSRRRSSLVPPNRDESSLPNGKDRLLPGETCLVNRAEIKKWNPSRMMTPRPDKAKTKLCDPTVKLAKGIEVVAYTVDTYACTSEEPNFNDGPWSKGQWRMIASCVRNQGSNSVSGRPRLQDGEIVIAPDGYRSGMVKTKDKGKGKAIATEHSSSPTSLKTMASASPRKALPSKPVSSSPKQTKPLPANKTNSKPTTTENTRPSSLTQASAALTKPGKTPSAPPVSPSPRKELSTKSSSPSPTKRQPSGAVPPAATTSPYRTDRRVVATTMSDTAPASTPTPSTSTPHAPGSTAAMIGSREFRLPALPTPKSSPAPAPSKLPTDVRPRTSDSSSGLQHKATASKTGDSVPSASPSQRPKPTSIHPAVSPAKANSAASSSTVSKLVPRQQTASISAPQAVVTNGHAHASLPPKPIQPRPGPSSPAGKSSTVPSTLGRPSVQPKWKTAASPIKNRHQLPPKPPSRDDNRASTFIQSSSTSIKPAAPSTTPASAGGSGGTSTAKPTQTSPVQRDGKRKAESSPVAAPPRKRPESIIFPRKS